MAVVVVNFGSHSLVEQNLATGDDPVGASADVVIVDNFSTADERAAIGEVCRRRAWHLVPMPTNGGFAAGVNAGVGAARNLGCTEILLVNPDAKVTGAVARRLHAAVVSAPETLVSPVVVSTAGRPYFHGIRVDLRSGRMRGRTPPPARAGGLELDSQYPLRDWLSAACLAMSVSMWERAGGFCEEYFLYWEDVDFSQRCVCAGGRLILRADLRVVHDEGATHGEAASRARSDVYYYYNCRNRLVYGARHLSRRTMFGWLLRTPIESRQILLRGGRRQILRRPSCLWAAFSGSVAGSIIAIRRMLTVQR
jgi:N-acetylglucosaminyl-diphospho-decaprenol L-rhamnosyltransferase